MTSNSVTRRLALLIDAENIPATLADFVVQEAAKFGELQFRTAYGDFSTHAKGWGDAILRHAISPMQVFRNGSGKNSADIVLVIDAMTLIFSGNVDGLCIASSDSDFSHLARTAREGGLDVVGIGASPVDSPFRLACRNYVTIAVKEKAAVSSPAPTVSITVPVQPDAKPVVAAPIQNVNPAVPVPVIVQVLKELADADGWAQLSPLGHKLRERLTGFTPKKYGAPNLTKLLQRNGGFVVEPNNGSARCRLKQAG